MANSVIAARARNAASLAVRRILQPFDIRVVRLKPNKVRGIEMALDLKYLLRHRSKPIIIDVGANDGEVTAELLSYIPTARVIAVEPFDESVEALKLRFQEDPRVQVVQCALGEHKASGWLNTFSGSRMNSLLPLSASARNVMRNSFTSSGGRAVSINTLDAFCGNERLTHIDLVKIDTQGYDLRVLQGAQGLLSCARIGAVVVEITFVPMYEQQGSFHDIDGLLTGYGYRLVELYNKTRTADHIAWCDCLYVIDPDVLSRSGD